MTLAAAIRHRGIPLALYHDTQLADEVITHAMPKVRWAYDAALDGHTFESSRVDITLKNGQRFSARCDVALGHPDNAMSLEQRVNKFVDCASAALAPVAKPRAMQIVDAVTRLERLDTIAPLMTLLA